MADVVRRQQPEYWAEHEPDRPAVVDGETVLTYSAWNQRADRLAAAIGHLPSAQGGIGVRLHQSPAWFILNLALAKLGRELTAVNWRLTAHEVAEIAADSGIGVLFLDDADPGPVHAALRERATDLVLAGTAPPPPGVWSFEELASRPTTAAYFSREPTPMVVYSSGTTGKAKGVRNPVPADEEERRVLLEYLGMSDQASEAKAARMVAVPHTLLSLPLHHGIGPKSARTCHERGGTVYLLDRFDPVRALELIDRHRITHWTTVPTMLQRIRALPQEVLDSFDVSSMRVLALGSAPSSVQLRDWAEGYFGPCLYEGYGAAEVGMVTYMRPVWRAAKPGSCGRPRRHVSVRIVGPDGEAPPGVEGEIYVRTPVTIRNYVNAEPLGTDMVSADGHFRTGDYGKLDEDGFLYITGRVKDMIIAGGVNIFPAEIEHALAEHPDVIEAAVFGVPEETFGEQVMAVCERRPGSAATAEELLAFVADRLAPFKRPRIIKLVDELPRNAMNKVIKAELRKPFWDGNPIAI